MELIEPQQAVHLFACPGGWTYSSQDTTVLKRRCEKDPLAGAMLTL